MPIVPLFVAAVVFVVYSPSAAALGSSATTIAVTSDPTAVCGIVAGENTQRIDCYHAGISFSINPEISYESIGGGRSFFCGLRSGGLSLLCWDAATFQPKRIYHSDTVRLSDLTVGDSHLCALITGIGVTKCWRAEESEDGGFSVSPSISFHSITAGRGFSCGIMKNESRVLCWGSRRIAGQIERMFSPFNMSSLVAGDSHACGFNLSGFLICKGSNSSGQLDVPPNSRPFEFSGIALGPIHSCAIQRRNGLVACWGGGGTTAESKIMNMAVKNVAFEAIVAGLDFTCGLRTESLSLVCWGPGWCGGIGLEVELPLPMLIPGPCVQSSCITCGVFPNSETLCGGSGNICNSCQAQLPLSIPLPLPALPRPPAAPSPVPQSTAPLSSSSRHHHWQLKAFAVVGSLGAFASLCAVVYCVLWTGVCGVLQKKIHNSSEATTGRANVGIIPVVHRRSKALASQSLRRQRSGTSSKKHLEKAEKFSLSELAAATNNFSLENKIGSGSFGTVFKGRLSNGIEVAIKRGETSTRRKKSQDKEIAFDSELVLLSRLHHKHLVGLIGFCHERDERLLVYEYMSNGALYDHLHSKKNIGKTSSILNSWRMRIKIALDAARGIEYLHNYAVPPIIHRDIKSSNILLDASWTGRVSDFGLSLMSSEFDQECISTEAVGTVGYIDPEYYVLNVLTTKSDVYGLGVVLLELLTGKRAVFRNDDDDGSGPMGVVEYAVPKIAAGEVQAVLDMRVGMPEVNEAEAIQMVAYTAMHCVSLEVRQRPSVSEIASNLEGALALCEGSHGSISNSSISNRSE